MDLQTLFNILLGVCITGAGWFLRGLRADIDKLREEQRRQEISGVSDLKKLEVKLAADYVRYDRLQDALKPLMDALDDIRNTLSQKADK